MTCAVCSYEFCWVCKSYAGPEAEHFQYDNILGCGVSMMDKQQRTWYERYGKRILIVLIVLFLWPVLCIFYCPVTWALKAYRDNKMNGIRPREKTERSTKEKRPKNRCQITKNPVVDAVLFFILGLLLAPIAAPFVFFYFFVVYVAYGAFKFFKRLSVIRNGKLKAV